MTRVLIDYTNWKGKRRERVVVPESIFWGCNEWHLKEQWLLHALDVEDNETKTFAMANIHSWRTVS